MLIRAYLKSLPWEVVEAENGQVAVDRFKDGRYDLVLMDVQMPVMDGRQAVREIRSWEKSSGAAPTPVIALTAHAVKEEIDRCLEAGCDAHLSKPVKKATLLEAIRRMTAETAPLAG
jgi:CheY-like chemotaxis protein